MRSAEVIRTETAALAAKFAEEDNWLAVGAENRVSADSFLADVSAIPINTDPTYHVEEVDDQAVIEGLFVAFGGPTRERRRSRRARIMSTHPAVFWSAVSELQIEF